MFQFRKMTEQQKAQIRQKFNVGKSKTQKLATSKPPKLKFKPGQFVRNNKTKELFCIRIAYRMVAEPNVWRFELEERADFAKPVTSTSALCEALTSGNMRDCPVIMEPLRSDMDLCGHPQTRDLYHFGDAIRVRNQTLLNDYTVVSSGEVE